jgi:pimeloyl-ACP methyl ester carboxylesterase
MLPLHLILTAAIPLCVQPAGPAHVPLPAELSGTLHGTPYKIRVPANWNGTLLVYAHGAASAGVEVSPPAFPPGSPTLEERLLSNGYALAGSFFEGLKDAGQRTLSLTGFFNGAVGHPDRTIVWGLSGGGWLALDLIENHHGIYDAAIAVAPVAAGHVEDADFELRYGLAYAAAFGWPSQWWGPLEDLRDDLYGNEATLIMPIFQWPTPQNYGRWEFVRLVMKIPPSLWWDVEPSLGLPGFALDGWKATALRSALEREFRGPVAQNVGAEYALTPDEMAYLSSLGVNAGQLLAWMNEHADITASRPARNHLAHYGTPEGDLRRPLLTMHGVYDPMLPTSHEALYGALVETAGHRDQLVQVYARAGHASFSAEQYLKALAAMEHWLDTDVRPDASFFPESAGFDNSYVPPPWPY